MPNFVITIPACDPVRAKAATSNVVDISREIVIMTAEIMTTADPIRRKALESATPTILVVSNQIHINTYLKLPLW